MAIFDAEEPEDAKSEEHEQKDGKNDRSLAFLLMFLPLMIFFFTDKPEFLIGIGLSLSMTIMAIGMCWEFRRRAWFWIVIALIQAFYISLAVLAHWPRVTMTKLILLPIGLMYFGLIVGVVRLLDKLTAKSSH